MTALVQRGAPRDFLDIYHVCTRGVMSMADCWRAFTEKGLGIDIAEAKRKIIARLAMIEASRPLETIQPGEARDQASESVSLLFTAAASGVWLIGPPAGRVPPAPIAAREARPPLLGGDEQVVRKFDRGLRMGIHMGVTRKSRTAVSPDCLMCVAIGFRFFGFGGPVP
jgi:hypothetical protein